MKYDKRRTVPLSQVCTLNMGQSPSSDSYNENKDGLPFFQGNADFGNIYPKERVWCSQPTKIANKDDILLSVRAPIGALNIAKEECCIGRGLAALSPIPSQCRMMYLFYALKSKVKILEQQGTGSTFKAVGKDIISALHIPLYPLEEQEHIISMLSCTDIGIANIHKQLAKLDTLVKSRFIEMFGDPITNSHRLSSCKLGDVCTLKAGNTTAPQEIRVNSDEEYKIPCYGGNGIRGYVQKATYSGEHPLIGRQGALCGNVQFASGNFHATEHAVLVTPKVPMNPIWLYVMLREMNLNRFQTGAAQPGLAVKTLNNVKIITPPIALQNQFADFVQQVDKSKSVLQKLLEKQELLRAALMQEYFG